MGLENILQGITKKLGERGANEKYSTSVVVDTFDYMQDFSTINPKTADGIKKYEELTGLPTNGISESEVNLRLEQITDKLIEGFSDYKHKHMPRATSELQEEIRSNIAYQFCPEEKSDNEEYEKARLSVYEAKKTIETINNDPEKFLKETAEKYAPMFKDILTRFPEKALQIAKQDAQLTAFRTISEYGSAKFIVETYSNQKSALETLEKDGKALDEKRQEKMKNMKPGLDVKEKAAYFKDINEEEQKLREKMSKLVDPTRISEAVYQTIIQQEKTKQQKSPEE